MKPPKITNLVLASLAITLPSHNAIAIEFDAHQHGSAALEIAIDANTIAMRFESPAVNIVGFEYTTDDDQQQLLITNAQKNLSNVDAIFQLVGDVSCKTTQVAASWVTKHEEDEDEHEGEHQEVHEEEHQDEHQEVHEEEHEEVLSAEHAEFIAEYQLECNQLNNLTAINVNLFEFFPAIADLDVQVIYSGGQIKQALHVNSTLIKLAN